MKTGRNDPCPCGSGKKYKKCCMKLDQTAGSTGSARGAPRRPSEARAEIAAEVELQADIVPMPARIENDPAARPGVLLVVSAGSGFVVHNAVLDRPSPEPEPMAEELVRGLIVACNRAGGMPHRVRVRYPELVPHVARGVAEWLLGTAEMEVASGPLPALDEAAFALAEHTSGITSRYHLAATEGWAAWDLPAEIVADLFHGAAGFWRAAPWAVLADVDVLEAEMPSGRRWTVCTLGNGGQVYGCNLFSEPDNFGRMMGRDQELAFDDFEGRVICLHLDPGREVGRAAVREAAAAGWEVADPRAYPRLLAINSPAGGVTLADARDLLAALQAVPRFVAENAGAVEELRPVEGWKDEPTGVVLSFSLGEDDADWSWPYEHLEPGDAQGPGAEPEAALAPRPSTREKAVSFQARERRFVDGFFRHLVEVKRLSEATAVQHGHNAYLFVDFLTGSQGIPVRAVHEYDLRSFLYDWYPREVTASLSESRAVPVSLKRFFDFLASEEGIECPWAKEILDGEREAFEAVVEGSSDPDAGDGGDLELGPGSLHDVVDRLLVPDSGLGEDDTWGILQGLTEAELNDELDRRWLLWRDELIRAGTDRPGLLAGALVERQSAWETTPHPDLGGRTPVEAIQAERRARQERSGAPERKGKRKNTLWEPRKSGGTGRQGGKRKG